MLPRVASRQQAPVGLAQRRVSQQRDPDRHADHRQVVQHLGMAQVEDRRWRRSRASRMKATMPTRVHSTRDARRRVLADRLIGLLLARRDDAEEEQRRHRGDVGVEHVQRAARRRSTSSWSWCRRPRCPSRRRSTRRTMAARKPMCTRPWYSTAAMLPPIIAAAMLSRKLDSTKTSTSMTKPPFQSSGRKRGRIAGTRLSSKWRDSSAKPSSRPNRLATMTHSWPQVPEQARRCPARRRSR